jgi:prepilin-type N-terminal cleavage/methylation domain-containing protein
MSMKKQSGFTLIELLLVLAIIGIISAIAIPALLSQRARARDKSAIENMTGSFSDLLGQYDKLREAGTKVSSIPTKLGSYITNNLKSNKNPWNANADAFDATVSVLSGNANVSAFNAKLAATSLGVAKYYIQVPNTTSGIGFFGGAVKVQNSVNGATTVTKSAAIE